MAFRRPSEAAPRGSEPVQCFTDGERPRDAAPPAVAHVPRPADGADRRLAHIAARSSGVVDLADTDAAGLSRRAVSRRVAVGRLHRIHPGVFAVGHPGLDGRGRSIAALRACGPGSLLTHDSGVAIRGLGPWPETPHMTASSRRALAGAVVHTARAMPSRHVVQGLPTTSVAQLLVDVAEAWSDAPVARLLNEALYRRLVSMPALEAFLAGCAGRHGVAVLRHLLPDAGARHSPLEDDFFALLRLSRLPLPQSNVKLLGHEIDFWWGAQRLVVETDGWAAHGTRRRFETDRERDADLVAAQIRIMRVTRHGLTTRPHAIAARLGAVLLQPA